MKQVTMASRCLAVAVFLACLCAGAAQAATPPSDESVVAMSAKCDEYVSYGWSFEHVAEGLRNWFGLTFEPYLDRAAGTVDYRVVLREPRTGHIYYLRTLCKAPLG